MHFSSAATFKRRAFSSSVTTKGFSGRAAVVGSKGITTASSLDASSFFSGEAEALLLQGEGEASPSSSFKW